MTAKLEDMTVEELLAEENWALDEAAQAFQFGDDSGDKRLWDYSGKVGAELEKRGICRGGLNDGCEVCQQ